MGVFLIPILLIVAITPMPGASEKTLTNFSRFSKAVGAPIAIIDREGTVREGRLSGATADSVTVQFGGGERVFSEAAVASAERLKDGVKDGFINLVIDQQQFLQGYLSVLQICLTDKYGFSGLMIDTGGGFADKDNIDALAPLVEQQIL